MKYYAVKKGRKTGIFTTWDDCKAQVNGYKGAVYKSFSTRREAQAYLQAATQTKAPEGLVAYVDGSFNAKTHVYGYGCVIMEQGQVIKMIYGKGTHPDYVGMRNVAGEIFGSEVAIEYAIANGYQHISVYYDYMGIEKWANGSWQANKPGTKAYAAKIKEYKNHITIHFCKVLAHSGNTYNDMADALAKKAAGIV